MAASDIIEHGTETGISPSCDAGLPTQDISSSHKDFTMNDLPSDNAGPAPQDLSSSKDCTMDDLPSGNVSATLYDALDVDRELVLKNGQDVDSMSSKNVTLCEDSVETDSALSDEGTDYACPVKVQTESTIIQNKQKGNGTDSLSAIKHPVLAAVLSKNPDDEFKLVKVPTIQVVPPKEFKEAVKNNVPGTPTNEKQDSRKLDEKQGADDRKVDLLSLRSGDYSNSSSDEIDTASETDEERKKIYDYTCDTCNKKFSRRYRLFKHIRTHLYHRKMYKCHYCPMELTLRRGLERHERIHTDEKPFKCDECGSKFRTKEFLQNHRYKDHGHDLPYLCDLCGMSFKTRNYYNNHKSIHTGEKKYECKKCSKQFRRPNSLRKHIQINHQALPCNVCSATCSSRRELQRHKMTHVKRAFPCDQCEASFNCSSNLTKHKNIHLGLKPHKCYLCSHGYSDRSNLNKHMKAAHNLKSANSLDKAKTVIDKVSSKKRKVKNYGK